MAQVSRPLTRAEREAGATAVFEVVGKLPIRDAVTRESVRPGGTVRLDPTRTDIAALIEAGLIKAKPTRAKRGGG